MLRPFPFLIAALRLQTRFALHLLVLALASRSSLWATLPEKARVFDVPAGEAAETLKRAALQGGVQIVFLADLVRGVRTPALRGEFTPMAAFDNLVTNTGLVVVRDESTATFTVTRRPTPTPSSYQTPKKNNPAKTMKQKKLLAFLGGFFIAASGSGEGRAASNETSPATTTAMNATATGMGSISGNVGNSGTGRLLEGARVDVPKLALTTLTDETGRFLLRNVPAGAHEVVASYLGLDPLTFTVEVEGGQTVTRDFQLTSGIYQLGAMTVTGEREGNAAALTAQRNSTNLKNVVAIDAYGNLPNMNASELAVLLPGVAGNLSDEGNIVGFTVRGMPPTMNSITVDGALMASQGAMQRQPRIHTITGAMFEALELTKGHTPDKEASSLGGTINLKSRSTLNMTEKRRITYNVSVRFAPPDTQQIPLREQHRSHPLVDLSWEEIYGIFGGERNFGSSLNIFYSEQVIGFFSTTRDFQNTNIQPAYLWDYRTQDNYNNRKQSSANAKFEFRYSPHTKFSLNLIYNDALERFRLRYLFRAFTGTQATVPDASTSGVIPGFTNRITSVRPVAASTIDITSQMSNFYHRQRHIDFGAEHNWGPFDVDYNAVLSLDHINGGGGDGGVLVNRVTGVGWTIDRTQSDLYPKFIQTAGPDISNPASYKPNSLTFADSKNVDEVRELRGNVRYKLPTEMTLYFKTGFRWREEKVADINHDRRSTFLGTNSAQIPTDPTIRTFGNKKTGLNIPSWSANAISRHRTPVDSTLWKDDIYFAESQKYIGTRQVIETVKAAYVMTQGMIGHTGFLTGVRFERTDDDSQGYVRARVPSTAAQQAADPAGAARADYSNTFRRLSGDYTKTFPSVHLTQDITKDLKARVSWSNSFGRPPPASYLPNETVSETAQTLTINNPNLKPQTAENWDLDLEYYFEPVGSLSVGWFHKKIEDYFVTGIINGTVGSGADNGYNGEYSGFTILNTENLGTAYVQGWEFAYQQQFTFLPGLLKGLGVSANYTLLDTHGDFGGSSVRTTGQVQGFIPETTNFNVSWRYRKLGTRVNLNRTGEYLNAYTANGSGRNMFTRRRTVVNVGAAYQYKPELSFSVDVGNIFNEAQVFYRGVADNISEYRIPGVTVTVGVSGRF